MSGYIGSAAVLASSGAERKKTYSITGATTSLTGLNYTVGQVHVFHNGVRLVDGTDFTATNGNSITLTNAAQSGDEVVVLSYAGYQVSDTVSASQGGTFSNDIAITGTVTADGLTVGIGDSIGVNSGNGFAIDASSNIDFTSGGVKSLRIREGDISFYEDTGTTAKLFWDASAESLGIGTSSPSSLVHANNTSGDATIRITSSDTGYAQIFLGDQTSGSQGRLEYYNNNNSMGFYTGGSEAMRIDSSGRVGIGTSSPSAKMELSTSDFQQMILRRGTSGTQAGILSFYQGDGVGSGHIGGVSGGGVQFRTGGGTGTERMRIDSSGNLLVGKTSVGLSTTGFQALATGNQSAFISDGDRALILNRQTSDGSILEFRKDGSTVGSIRVASGGSLEVNPNGGVLFLARNASNGIEIINSLASGTPRLQPSADNTVDLGLSSRRFDDIYATNGTIQTSDRNEKQDIEALSDAEQRVAVACKGLLRKFRWIDSVAEKGDDARIHFGIIAQDLQDAFAAEGLDAGDYAMFISTTWWETQTEVPAVEAVAEVLDEEGNVVTEAVEAKEAYIRTDTYDTLEEAPEGATERTRLGVRYPELLAFIIGAM